MQSAEVRESLVKALKLDLVGPETGFGDLSEILPQAPSRWYLTGFLIPRNADDEEKVDEESSEELASEPPVPGIEDGAAPDPASAKKKFMPSSMGLSILVPKEVDALKVLVRWGDYTRQETDAAAGVSGGWKRSNREQTVALEIPDARKPVTEKDVPNSNGLKVAWSVRPVNVHGNLANLIPVGTKVVSVFVVNRRAPAKKDCKDEAYAFQVQLVVTAEHPFVARPDLRSFESSDWDERVADLQYRDAYEHAVGHAVSAEAIVRNGKCTEVRTCWIPSYEVERVAPVPMSTVELSMDALSKLTDGNDAKEKLGNLPAEYKKWIAAQASNVPQSPARRKETGDFLLERAAFAATRIQQGIDLLADPKCLDAFKIANKVMAQQAKQRRAVWLKKDPAAEKPKWFPFQLAFVLMNLKGIADPKHVDRTTVDLLFFPTGGGKTEAYLGLAAFTLVLRRLKNPSIQSAGLSVLMRYTLRLLTLDQLSRAATMICALEIERKQHPDTLGKWPFEIGLWVGQAATPNRMGGKGESDRHSARARTITFQKDTSRPPPIPLRECPWCGTQFGRNSFELRPNPDQPTDLLIRCVSRDCHFTGGNYLPIQAVDEPIYRRLPCFMIATVDKFAAMPWTGEVGGFFGRVDRHDGNGFYGPCDPGGGQAIPGGRLPPPDLIIQDELHLISGPLGTMVGLYETALDELASVDFGGSRVRPKIIASTATVRRAETQIQALFNRSTVDIFPPPGPDRRDSFFARVLPVSESSGRLYVGVAAQGRSPKLIMLRTYLAQLAAAKKLYDQNPEDENNPADPYMTLLGYFNALRELGGCRRVIEDEVNNRLRGYETRKRVGEANGIFSNRQIDYEPLELTSRISTAKVAEAKRRLAESFCTDGAADVAIATNMISVGLDIVRLGLMIVFGQPKSSAEYIQATSRVGRDPKRPGLVMTLLNIHKPRDRSHYERFCAFHQSFYRTVEATSVTPFSPRALDRGLAATLVSLARLGYGPMTPATEAGRILTDKAQLDFAIKVLKDRAGNHQKNATTEEEQRFSARANDTSAKLLEIWLKIAKDLSEIPASLKYQKRDPGNGVPLLHDFLDPVLKTMHPWFMKFRANRSMRDVEPDVNLRLKTLDKVAVEAEEEDEE